MRLCRRYRRVIFRAWLRLRARGLVAGLFQVRFFFRAVVCGELVAGERRLCAGVTTVFSGGGEVISGDLAFDVCFRWGGCLVGGGVLVFTPYE